MTWNPYHCLKMLRGHTTSQAAGLFPVMLAKVRRDMTSGFATLNQYHGIQTTPPQATFELPT